MPQWGTTGYFKGGSGKKTEAGVNRRSARKTVKPINRKTKTKRKMKTVTRPDSSGS